MYTRFPSSPCERLSFLSGIGKTLPKHTQQAKTYPDQETRSIVDQTTTLGPRVCTIQNTAGRTWREDTKNNKKRPLQQISTTQSGPRLLFGTIILDSESARIMVDHS